MKIAANQIFEQIFLHHSQFPDKVYTDYSMGIIQKNIPHKFHYDTVEQSQKWHHIHKQYSPFFKKDCLICYENGFEATAKIIHEKKGPIEIISLGCGSGEKDARLLTHLQKLEQNIAYYPVDVSLSLTVMAAQRARAINPDLYIKPIVCDLLHATDVIQMLKTDPSCCRVIAFLGMIMNFSPNEIGLILNSFLNPGDILLLSTNLAPGSNYLAGIKKVMCQYDNTLTRDWLFTVLKNLGISPADGEIQFSIQSDHQITLLKKISACFVVNKKVTIAFHDTVVEWNKDDKIQLFFSYRYTTDKIKDLLATYNINVLSYWC